MSPDNDDNIIKNIETFDTNIVVGVTVVGITPKVIYLLGIIVYVITSGRYVDW